MERLNKISKIFNKIYYNLFVENFKGKLHYNFPQNYFRWDLIEYLINKYGYSDYLEIGCDQDQLFSKIKIQNKVGVDPSSGGNVRKTSDEFFKENKNKFDIVFIDGLHTYDQVKKDILNSLNFLKNDGIILLHDCLPNNYYEQATPRCQWTWNGDVWKTIVEFRKLENVDVYTCNADQGIGVILKRQNRNLLDYSCDDFSKLNFEEFFHQHKKIMNIIEYEKLMEII